MKWIIAILGLAAGLIHAFIGISGIASVPAETMDWILLANGLGYLVLLFLYLRASGNRSTIRWLYIAFTLVTFIGYFVVWGADGLSNPIGLVTKGIELLLIITLLLDRRNDVVPSAATAASRASEVKPPPQAMPEAQAPVTRTAVASAAAASAGASMDDDIDDAGDVVDRMDEAVDDAVDAAQEKGAMAATAVAGTVAAAADAVDDAADDAVEEMGDAADAVGDAAEDAVDDMSDAADAMAERVKDFFSDDESEEEAAERLRTYVDGFGADSEFHKSIDYIETVGPGYSDKLRSASVERVGSLLVLGATRKGRRQLAEATGVPESQILTWVNHVDLYRINGVSKIYANLLEASGVDTVIELAHRNSSNLHERMAEVNGEKALVARMPSLSEVENWVAQAKQLPRVIHY